MTHGGGHRRCGGGIFVTKWSFVLLTIVADDALWLTGLEMLAVV